jgi:ATP-dependent Clp protease ATP-binding subunit ClpA
MNINARELRDRAGKMIDQAQALVKTAEIEDRDFTEEEQKEYDGFVKESEALQARAVRMENLEGLSGMLNDKKAPSLQQNPTWRQSRGSLPQLGAHWRPQRIGC